MNDDILRELRNVSERMENAARDPAKHTTFIPRNRFMKVGYYTDAELAETISFIADMLE